MSVAIVPIGRNSRARRQGTWSLVKLARPGHAPVPLGVVLVEDDTDEFSFLLRDAALLKDAGIEELAESDRDVIEALPADLEMKAREMGGNALLRSLEESLSHFLHISHRTAVSFAGSSQVTVKRLLMSTSKPRDLELDLAPRCQPVRTNHCAVRPAPRQTQHFTVPRQFPISAHTCNIAKGPVMPAAVIPISRNLGAKRYGNWSLVELARPGHAPVPLGILLLEDNTDELSFLLRDASEIEDLDESDQDVIEALPADLKMKAREMGGNALLRSLEESLSHFLRISDRTAISFAGSPQVTVNQLFDEHVETEVRPFITHLPVYSLKAAATKFGGEGEAEQLDWARVPKGLRLNEGMFIAQVVGRSMEPLIPDGSYCVFRTPVTGTRQGKRLLIELFGSDATGRYTVKRYTSIKSADPETGEWQHERIRLEPLNREFEAFDLAPDQFKVIAEFVQVLPS